MSENAEKRKLRALAVFHDNGAGFLSRLLKPGFRHVFVTVLSGNCWIEIDGRLGIPGIQAIAPADFDLAAYYRNEGCTVVETTQRDRPPHSPFAIANCVGLVKAVLCIRSAAITPYALYRHLRRKT